MNVSWRLMPQSLPTLAANVLMGGMLIVASSSSPTAVADDQAEVESGPWISAIAWVDDATLVGTQSQGLLLRPATVVKATVDSPATHEEVESVTQK